MEKPRLARQTTLGCLLATLALFGTVATAAPARAAAAHHAHRHEAHPVYQKRTPVHRGRTRDTNSRRRHGTRHRLDAGMLPEMQVVTGPGFDTCWAPPLSAMQVWRNSSPYRAVGIYIGGRNRACVGGNLTPDWVSGVTAQGWGLIPVYVGLQAPCVSQKGTATMHAGQVVQEAGAEADDAASQARSYGLDQGSPIYFDLEAFKESNQACVSVVLAYIDAWTRELHADGYYAGLYGSAASGIATIATAVQSQPSFNSPDAIWIARWDRQANTDDGSVPDSLWPGHQRIKQFQGGHVERHGGVAIEVDSDFVDGPVALVS